MRSLQYWEDRRIDKGERGGWGEREGGRRGLVNFVTYIHPDTQTYTVKFENRILSPGHSEERTKRVYVETIFPTLYSQIIYILTLQSKKRMKLKFFRY